LGFEKQKMTTLIYILLSFFVFGGFLLFLINRKKSALEKRQSLIKYFSYFFIVAFILISIQFFPKKIIYLFLIILMIGCYELIKTVLKSEEKHLIFFTLSIIIYFFLGFCFLKFSTLKQETIQFTYLIVIVFDAFSQVIGQLFGKVKLFPKISPNKTIEGLIGGFVFVFLFTFLFNNSLITYINRLFFTLIVSISSLIGDFLASVYKRKYNIKDYSKLIPQHGGFLDRFDSFIFSGATIYFLSFILYRTEVLSIYD
jgi:phosphatidate cytidylyltransferase